MTDTLDLIAQLSADAKPTSKMRAPIYWSIRLLAVLAIYAAGCQLYLGLRSDLTTQLARPLFIIETILLLLLLISSVVAFILAMYPDAYQKQRLLKLPYYIFIALVLLVLFQIIIPHDARMMMPEISNHGMECAIFISSLALTPSAFIFALLRKGASVRQFQSGSFVVLSTSSIGCLTLRLAEENDSIIHLLQWHYVPTMLFAALGALLGKWLLKW
jgi:hypothetical protein